jgi:ketosteroid isomerase-like protein
MAVDGSPVLAWYEAAPLDIDRMRELLDPDVEFKVCAGWPNGGTFHGHEGVLGDFFPGAACAWERIRPEIDEVIEASDTFIVRGRYEGIAAGTQIPFSVEFVHIWRVADGRLVSLHQIADTAILADAVAGREAAPSR